MEVQIISRNLIKPSTPTPLNLRSYKISSTDELAPAINVPLILFYPSNGNADVSRISLRCNELKKSLQQTLTQFYPLAGRYMEDEYLVDCSDQGAKYVEAKVNLLLDQGMKLKPELLNSFIACEIGAVDEISDPLLAIQVTTFECGGLAVGVCISHRIADASTLSMFINEWAAACRGDRIEHSLPNFNSASFFPGRKLPKTDVKIPRTFNANIKVSTRRFLFTAKAISSLRDKVKMNGTEIFRPSRTQLVFALILKTMMDIEGANHGGSRTTAVIQPVNLRGKANPPIPAYSCGNLWGVAIPKGGSGTEFHDLVDLLTNAVRKTADDWGKICLNNYDEAGQMVVINPLRWMSEVIANYELSAYWFSSWSRFPFYEADFGWGKPDWVSQVNIRLKNVVFLLDDKEGEGIEAWVNLDEKDMISFEQDSNIRTFTS